MNSSDSSPSSSPPSESAKPRFIFVACHPSCQDVCKREVLEKHPVLSFAFSRPGFMTFKLAPDVNWPFGFDLRCTFARTYGWSSHRLDQSNPEALAQVASERLQQDTNLGAIHIWQRVATTEGKIDRIAPDADFLQAFQQALSAEADIQRLVNRVAPAESKVLDLIQMEDSQWWLAEHQANARFQRWPGGIPLATEDPNVISRAYYKAQEALLWSGMPIGPQDVCAEIGSAPGGSCQRLLETGAQVIAIDPADLDERIAQHEKLTHLKKRGRDVPHRELANVKWLLVDSNVVPQQTLDTVEAITQGNRTNIRGMLLTLKFTNWDMATQIPLYTQRVRDWGFRYVKTRHLAFGKREICLMAMRRKTTQRFRR